MFTFEDCTSHFLKAAEEQQLVTHPEYWMNSRSLEREFSSICHTGSCDDADQRAACTFSFSWGPLDTVLSQEGPQAICQFFHEEDDEQCKHLHTDQVPPLILDLSYNTQLRGAVLSDEALLMLSQQLRFRAGEQSRRAGDSRPSISLILEEGRLKTDLLTLNQRVELPLWQPNKLAALVGARSFNEQIDYEEWLPRIMQDITQDILSVLNALDDIVRPITPED